MCHQDLPFLDIDKQLFSRFIFYNTVIHTGTATLNQSENKHEVQCQTLSDGTMSVKCNFSIATENKTIQIGLFDMQGRLLSTLFSETLQSRHAAFSKDRSSLTAGDYILKVTTGNNELVNYQLKLVLNTMNASSKIQ